LMTWSLPRTGADDEREIDSWRCVFFDLTFTRGSSSGGGSRGVRRSWLAWKKSNIDTRLYIFDFVLYQKRLGARWGDRWIDMTWWSGSISMLGKLVFVSVLICSCRFMSLWWDELEPVSLAPLEKKKKRKEKSTYRPVLVLTEFLESIAFSVVQIADKKHIQIDKFHRRTGS